MSAKQLQNQKSRLVPLVVNPSLYLGPDKAPDGKPMVVLPLKSKHPVRKGRVQ
jgi:hypothetical protein